MDRHGRRFPQGFAAPDAVEEGLLAEDDARILGKEQEELEFLIGQGHFFPLDEDAVAALIDFQIAVVQDVAMDFAGRELFIPGQVAFDAGYELIGTEGLDDVVIGAQAEAADLVDVFLPGRYHEDRDVLGFADSPANLEAIAAGQHDVQQDEVIGVFQGFLFPYLAIDRDVGTEAIGFQVVPFQFGNALVVFNNQDTFHVCDSPFGNEMQMVNPLGTVAWAQIFPFMAWTICWTTASPKPLPLATLVRALSVR